MLWPAVGIRFNIKPAGAQVRCTSGGPSRAGSGRAGLQGTEGVTWVGVENQAARSGVFGLEAEQRWFRFLQISMKIFLLRADSWWQDGDRLSYGHRKNMITSDWTAGVCLKHITQHDSREDEFTKIVLHSKNSCSPSMLHKQKYMKHQSDMKFIVQTPVSQIWQDDV